MSGFFSFPRLAALARWANIGTAIVAPVIVLLVWPLYGPVTPLLLRSDPSAMRRLTTLEEELRRHPGDVVTATEVGRLWQAMGQSPWSYTALREAERRGPQDAASKLRLAAAYLDIGELDDTRRALAAARKACERSPCPEPVEIKLSLFTRLTDNLARDGIEPRRDLAFTGQALQKLLREIEGKPPSPPKRPGLVR